MEEAIKLAVRSLYDSQKLRIEMGNRISAQVRLGVLSDEWQERLSRHLLSLEAVEKELLKDVGTLIKDYDIYSWLKSVKGAGPAMSGVILSEIRDPGRFDTVSKLWAYCGLHVIDGRAVRRTKGKKANWNAFLKTKLIGVLGPSFLKCSSPYREFYDNYKTRLENRPCSMSPAEHNKTFGQERPDDQVRRASQDGCETHKLPAPQKLQPNGCTAGHMHNKAVRYMVKMFLADLWVEWRTIRGLEVREPYAVEYLRKEHAS